jgi:hypothetical protein
MVICGHLSKLNPTTPPWVPKKIKVKKNVTNIVWCLWYSFLCLWSHLLILMFVITSTHSYVCDHIFVCCSSIYGFWLTFYFFQNSFHNIVRWNHRTQIRTSMTKWLFVVTFQNLIRQLRPEQILFDVCDTHSYVCDHIYSFLCLWSHLLILMFVIRSKHKNE